VVNCSQCSASFLRPSLTRIFSVEGDLDVGAHQFLLPGRQTEGRAQRARPGRKSHFEGHRGERPRRGAPERFASTRSQDRAALVPAAESQSPAGLGKRLQQARGRAQARARRLERRGYRRHVGLPPAFPLECFFFSRRGERAQDGGGKALPHELRERCASGSWSQAVDLRRPAGVRPPGMATIGLEKGTRVVSATGIGNIIEGR